MNINLTKQVKRHWWSQRTTTDCLVECRECRHLFPDVLDFCLRHLVGFSFKADNRINDIKGRDTGVSQFENLATGQRPKTNELLYVEGNLHIDQQQTRRYKVRLISEFVDFPSSNHIQFKVSETRSHELPEEIPTEFLGLAFPMETTAFRIGIEYFTPRYLGSMFGVSPVVDEFLHIDALEDQIKFHIYSEATSKVSPNPLVQAGTFSNLGRLLQKIFNFNLNKSMTASKLK